MKKQKEKQKLVSVAEYALLCGICRMAVHKRIEAGTLEFAKTRPQNLIDILKYPAKKEKRGRKPYVSMAA